MSFPGTVFQQAEILLEMATPGRELSEQDAQAVHAAAIFMLQITESMAMAQREKFNEKHGTTVFSALVPAEVFQRPVTAADVKAYPEYFINGPGRLRAQYTLCEHDYGLLDSCPLCP